MINLREKDYKKLCSLVKEYFTTPVEVWAYGSRVTGKNHEGSDLDLVVRGDGSKAFHWDFAEFRDALEESTIPILVDVFSWDRIPESFQKNILKQYEILCSTGFQHKHSEKGV